jgi:hypothetical protein
MRKAAQFDAKLFYLRSSTLKIFLDDERDSPPGNWTVVRDLRAFAALGFGAGANVISFDHDLGSDQEGNLLPSGHDCLRSMVNAAQDDPSTFEALRTVLFHSANPIGRANMRGLVESAQRNGILTGVNLVERPVTSFPVATWEDGEASL